MSKFVKKLWMLGLVLLLAAALAALKGQSPRRPFNTARTLFPLCLF